MTVYRIPDPGAFSGMELTLLNRCRAHGIPCVEDKGSTLVDAPGSMLFDRLGIKSAREAEGQDGGIKIRNGNHPRIAIYGGAAIGYPYWGYYAHALLSIGLTFVLLSEAKVAAGRLRDFSLLVLPGGFATWGLDRAEKLNGIDSAIRDFVETGGTLIGSCGGAFYVSEGRPGWLAAVDATPKFSHEYLMTGAALVSIQMDDPELAKGLPESVELPYYHGPIYTNAPRSADTLGRFRNYIQSSRLFIDNPLDWRFFREEMQNTPAIMSADFGRGKVLVFSPHPEMGEFVRKGIVLETYVRRFLPIRGHDVMDQTLQFYTKEEGPGFRLIYNAILHLSSLGQSESEAEEAMPGGPVSSNETARLSTELDHLNTALDEMYLTIEQQIAVEQPAMQRILKCEIGRRHDEWRETLLALSERVRRGGLDADLVAGLTATLDAAVASLRSSAKIAENLVLAEMPVRLCAAALRLILCDDALRDLI